MKFHTLNIPAPQPDPNAVTVQLAANAGLLNGVKADLATTALQQINENVVNLNQAIDPITKAVNRQLKSNAKLLDKVIQPLKLTVASGLAEGQIALNDAAFPQGVDAIGVKPVRKWWVLMCPQVGGCRIYDSVDETSIAKEVPACTILAGPYETEAEAAAICQTAQPGKEIPLPPDIPLPPIFQPAPPLGGFIPAPMPGQPGQPVGGIVVNPVQPGPQLPFPVQSPPIIVTPPIGPGGGPIILTSPRPAPTPVGATGPVGQAPFPSGPLPPGTNPISSSPIGPPTIQPTPIGTIATSPIGQPPICPPCTITTSPIGGIPPTTIPPISPISPPIVTTPIVSAPIGSFDLPALTKQLCDYLATHIQGGLPFPGTEAFCKYADEAIGAIISLSDYITDLVAAGASSLNAPLPDCTPYETAWDVTKLPAWVNCLFTKYTQLLINFASQEVVALMGCWKQLNHAMVGCNPSAVLGLTIIKSVLKVFSATKFGINFGVRLDVTISAVSEKALEMIDSLIAYACPLGFPNGETAIGLWLLGEIEDFHLVCLLRVNDLNPDLWLKVAHMKRARLTEAQTIELGKRHGLDDATITKALRTLGWVDGNDTSAALELWNRLPNTQETIYWKQHGLLNDAFVRSFTLDSGFEEQYWPTFGNANQAQGVTKEIAKQGYMKGWTTIAVQTLNTMRRRLRPDRVDANLVLTSAQYDSYVNSLGLPPFFVDRFKAVQFEVPGIRHLRQRYVTNEMDEKELAGRYQDIGYSEEDAKAFALQDRILGERSITSQIKGLTPTNMSRLLPLGLISEANVQAKMGELHYTQDQAQELIDNAKNLYTSRIITRASGIALSKTANSIQQAFAVGVIDRAGTIKSLSDLGFPQEYSSAITDAIDLGEKTKIATKSIEIIRKAVLSGELNTNDVGAKLTIMGIDPNRVFDLVSLWKLQLATNHKPIAAGKVLDLVRKGFLDVSNARVRLHNLGYTDADGVLLLAESEAKQFDDQARLAKASEKSRAAEAKALQSQIDKTTSQEKRLRDQLCRTTPVATLQRWFAENQVGERYLRDRWTYCGFTPEVIDKYVEDAKLKAEKYKGAKTNGTVSNPSGQ